MLQTITIAYAIIFGLCFGSFANVLVYRLPRGESIIKPPSHCPACNGRLAVKDLIPVFSWLFLRGRCRYCRERISWRYPAVELACALLFAGVAAYTGPELFAIPLCMLAFVLLCVSLIDINTQEIPDGLLIFGAAVGIAWILLSIFMYLNAPVWYDALLGMLAGALPLLLIDRLSLLLLKKDGFGYGDVKLMAMAGLFLGWQKVLASLFFAVVAGALFGAALLITRRAEKETYMAFGPFLSMGVLASLWLGEPFIELFIKAFQF